MLTMLEKVLILKSVGLFAGTPDTLLAEISAMLHEVELAAEEIVFGEGDPGSSMFIIAYGRVRVFDQQRTLNILGARDVFGEMALLDPEPRIASVSTMEDTLLLRIDHQPFFELLADRREVAYGIIRVLSHYVRERVADIARIDGQIRALAD